jgi:predicted small lipoprotein YifL
MMDKLAKSLVVMLVLTTLAGCGRRGRVGPDQR